MFRKCYNFIKKALAFLVLFCICFLFIFSCTIQNNTSQETFDQQTILFYPENYLDIDLPDHRIDIVRFHHTISCYECYLISDAIKEILKEKFYVENQQGLVTYREINSDYFENNSLLLSYGARDQDIISHAISFEVDRILRHDCLWFIADDQELLNKTLVNIIQHLLDVVTISKKLDIKC